MKFPLHSLVPQRHGVEVYLKKSLKSIEKRLHLNNITPAITFAYA